VNIFKADTNDLHNKTYYLYN